MSKQKLEFTIKIDSEKCKGCGLCISVCPNELINKSKDPNNSGYYPVEIKGDYECTDCKHCVIMCPDVAISIYQESNE